MAHFKKLIENENVGKLVYNRDIVEEIVKIAVSEVPYVMLYGSECKVSFEKDGVDISVSIKVYYTQSVSDIAFKIQETIRHNVESMTEYHVSNVNVYVKDVVFEDQVQFNLAEETIKIGRDVDAETDGDTKTDNN